MTHRNIELQVALPKITEVTRVQQQMQQQHANNHADFEKLIQNKAELDLTRPDSTDENRSVSDGSGKEKPSQQEKRNNKKKQQPSPQAPPHPYKGRHVDFRG